MTRIYPTSGEVRDQATNAVDPGQPYGPNPPLSPSDPWLAYSHEIGGTSDSASSAFAYFDPITLPTGGVTHLELRATGTLGGGGDQVGLDIGFMHPSDLAYENAIARWGPPDDWGDPTIIPRMHVVDEIVTLSYFPSDALLSTLATEGLVVRGDLWGASTGPSTLGIVWYELCLVAPATAPAPLRLYPRSSTRIYPRRRTRRPGTF